jgi:hypothetical protein
MFQNVMASGAGEEAGMGVWASTNGDAMKRATRILGSMVLL